MKKLFFFWIPALLLIFVPVISGGCDPLQPQCEMNPLLYEAEGFTSSVFSGLGSPQQIRIEDQSNASQGKGVHIGPDNDNPSDGVGDALIYNLSIPHSMNGTVEIRYADDVAGNSIALYWDDQKKGSFVTEDTGVWNDFEWSCQKINLGPIKRGAHTLKLEVIGGGTYGTIIDCFKICNPASVRKNDQRAAYLFVKSLINPATGLVKSTEVDNWTTVYKNALAAMAFLHEGNYPEAERIFDFFNSKYDPNHFQGFTQFWNAQTGVPEGALNYWTGDNSFLLIALHYYRQRRGSFGRYQSMVNGLVEWLAESANSKDGFNYDQGDIIPEGLIDIFAALKPFENSLPNHTPDVLLKLHSGFLQKAEYANVADHIERSALTLGDLSGFKHIANFQKVNLWSHNQQTQINALSAFSWEDFINTEISAQLLLTWKIWRDDMTPNLSYLQPELEKMWLRGIQNHDSYGIPYLTQDFQNPIMYNSPIIDSTVYLLFYYWGFNPMAPGKPSCHLDYDFQECEAFTSQTGNGVKETHSDAVGNETLQIGADYNEVSFTINLHQTYDHAKFQIRYTDDVAGNILKIYVDDLYRGEFTTLYTGGWNNFLWNRDIFLGLVNRGAHTIKIISLGGTYGVNLDIIKISN